VTTAAGTEPWLFCFGSLASNKKIIFSGARQQRILAYEVVRVVCAFDSKVKDGFEYAL